MVTTGLGKSLRGFLLLMGACLLQLSGCSNISKFFSANDELRVDEIWTAQVGQGVGKMYVQLMPAVTENVIYAADSTGQVQALNRQNGKLIWKQLLNTPLSGGVTAGYGLVLLGSSEGEVLALDQGTGQEKWRVLLSSEVSSAPQYNGRWVLTQTADGSLYALDGTNGQKKWVYKTTVPSLSLKGTSTPKIVQDRVYAGFATGKFVALSLENGLPIWEAIISLPQGRSELDRIVDIDGRFVIEGALAYVSAYQGKVVALQLATGQIIWKNEQSTYSGLENALSNIYLANSEGVVLALDQSTGQEVWKQQQLQGKKLTLPVKMGQSLVLADEEGSLYYLSQLDGRVMATYRIAGLSDRANPATKDKAKYTPIVREAGNGIRTPVVVKDEYIYVQTNLGVLKALKVTEKS